MAKVVIDTNVVFSALMRDDSLILKVLLESSNIFFAPNFVFVELYKHKEKLTKLSKLSENDILNYLQMLVEHITFVGNETVCSENKAYAYTLCVEVDPKDTPFVALAIELNALLWTGDKRLKKHLLQKGFDNFFDAQ